MLKKIIAPAILGTALSLFFFPIGFTFLPPTVNSKMLLAVLGVVIFVSNCIRNRSISFSKDIFFAAVIAAVFSLSCYTSITINNTNDVSYAQYYLSFFVWLGGAYAVCSMLRGWYGEISIHTLAKYIIWIGVAQAISVLLIDNIPAFSNFVDSFMDIGQAHVRKLNRKYGIGSALDSGGVRFAVVLVILAFELCENILDRSESKWTFIYILSFFLITVVGNMVSRTTITGAVLGLGYILMYLLKLNRGIMSSGRAKAWAIIILTMIIVIPLLTFLYNTNENMHSSLRFAFEGFFNWAETGEFRTDSTDKLNGVMWVWPDNPRDWFIGTGLFEGFIYSTDIGYCRFILYCGLLGFSIFSLFFVYNAAVVWKKFDNSAILALLLMALVFIIWVKVATDIFFVFSLLLCTDSDSMLADEDDEADEENEEPATVYKGIAKGILD